MSQEILSTQTPSAIAMRRETTLDDVFNASDRRLVVQMYGVVGDIFEAEDLVQDAFVRAASIGRRFLSVTNHEAWVRKTAINLHRNRMRKLRNYAKIRHRLAEPSDLPGLEEHVSVIAALRALPESQREVIALYYLADLSVAEVADSLNCPVGTVKSRLHRGRETLASTLAIGEEQVDA